MTTVDVRSPRACAAEITRLEAEVERLRGLEPLYLAALEQLGEANREVGRLRKAAAELTDVLDSGGYTIPAKPFYDLKAAIRASSGH